MQHESPPFPSLFWKPQYSTVVLKRLDDMWRFTVYWTLILYGLFHMGAVAYALLMQLPKARSSWKFLWLVPLTYFIVAAAEALIAGSVVGLIVGASYLVGGFTMSTWIPFVWGWVNLLILVISSFRMQGEVEVLIRWSTIPDLEVTTTSPTTLAPNTSYNPDRIYQLHQPKSLAGIAGRSFMLGSTFTLGLLLTFYLSFVLSSPIWRLAFFLTTLSTFHYLEFLTTAAYNTRAADTSSFLLTANWPAYAIAHTVAFLECFLAHFFLLPSSWGISFFLTPYHVLTSPFVVFLGLLLVIMGQAIRSLAMIHAGPSFNHHVQFHRSYDHVLVTTGIYSLLRHPSYFGFFTGRWERSSSWGMC
ncbi:uncharacterized protein CTHT_0069440 [Thermochaetoides thermophila DSM 1495]|uniref:Protein-S-isoprenylcysteine O-methyltransferase n=1 Tax=Chaetomium thermophilum (strain DSM 1495 / CBS 144.50 / IMI 039719) TaxID=759272 RepID=G0SHB6_CHATD|nr:hypothetical protein CTHT_0069440 [Thermochaetoides thermophila DSM 1495]EGS17605.1 hypothetical protein CTHT_0069440 [Thermochaetoides thermophila DSM 1495]